MGCQKRNDARLAPETGNLSRSGRRYHLPITAVQQEGSRADCKSGETTVVKAFQEREESKIQCEPSINEIIVFYIQQGHDPPP